ncbi:PQQ-dependent sugar dehydrogenase [Actinomycetaceae bacterium MB13-C1-2]|nr:PQQ-dependent sugar dehydrogenase [Actinomycetaceae bacterium MB13-C1-2]
MRTRPNRRRKLSWAGLAAVAIALAGCSQPAEEIATDPDPTPQSSAHESQSRPQELPQSLPEEEPEPTFLDTASGVVVTNLAAPWSIAFGNGATFISERDSRRVLELTDDGQTREVGVIGGAAPLHEGGLLGLAVNEGYLYCYYTSPADNRIVRFKLQGEPGSYQLGSEEILLDGIPFSTNHNGGRLAFGPDGMLYATTGDAYYPTGAQDLSSLAGKILRLTPDGGVPADNPFEGSPVYTYGHRNVQGLAWGSDGTMYASEFGDHAWDELNIIHPGGNYGWPIHEGVSGAEGFIDPIAVWTPEVASPSGIAIADGSIYMANLRGMRLRVIPLGDLTSFTELYVEEYGRLRDVVVRPNGKIWILTNNTDGRVDPGPDDDKIIAIN